MLAALLLAAPISTTRADDDKIGWYAYILSCGITVYDDPEMLIAFEVDDDFFLDMLDFYEWFYCEFLGGGRQ